MLHRNFRRRRRRLSAAPAFPAGLIAVSVAVSVAVWIVVRMLDCNALDHEHAAREPAWPDEVCEMCGRVGTQLDAPCPGPPPPTPNTATKSAPRVRF